MGGLARAPQAPRTLGTPRHSRGAPRHTPPASSGGPRHRLLASRAAELELDVVGVAKDQDADAEGLTEITDLAVRDAMAVQDPHGVVQRCAGADLEAHVIEPDAVLVEAI